MGIFLRSEVAKRGVVQASALGQEQRENWGVVEGRRMTSRPLEGISAETKAKLDTLTEIVGFENVCIFWDFDSVFARLVMELL